MDPKDRNMDEDDAAFPGENSRLADEADNWPAGATQAPRKRRHWVLRLFAFLFASATIMAVGGGLVVTYMLWQLSQGLPEYESLADYAPPIMSRVHAGDGSLIAELARERRLYVPIEAIPDQVVTAFLAAEDKNFYEHGGVDVMGVARAALANVFNLINNRRLEGASTITQQVAKNFLLSSEVSIERKVKEALLAFRLERAYTKDKILELYLNEIYLGMRSYGIAAASLNYFNKSLDQLTLAEAAYLAALPKAPANYHPFRQPERAVSRRNWVIERMMANGSLDRDEAALALIAPLGVSPRPPSVHLVDAEYFVEEVRRQILEIYGEEELYDGGLSIRTTLDTRLQAAARQSLRSGMIDYDQRHGWRGSVAKVEVTEEWPQALADMSTPDDFEPWRLAVVLETNDSKATIGLRPIRQIDGEYEEVGRTIDLPLEGMKWARKWLSQRSLGPEVEKVSDVLNPGDVVYVELATIADEEGAETLQWALRQIPDVNGAIVALDPHTGRVLALAGGFSFDQSEFNRATQALRQPGSSFKPFVYAAALDHGMTPSTLVLDAPFVMDQGFGQGFWKPENYSQHFYGPSTLRLGIEKSRNVMTVRLAQEIGMEPIVDNARRFGIVERMDPVLSMALGAGETTLLNLTAAYAMLVNGGKSINPTLVDRIQDRWGQTVYRHDRRMCDTCRTETWDEQAQPQLTDIRPRVLDDRTAYQVVSMLEGVVLRGTASRVRAVGKPVAGKTGTTNDERDAWFIGFSPDLAVGVFIGFDNPSPLGRAETGGRVAAPVFRDFMTVALADRAATPFRIPPGISLVRVNAKTGLLAQPGDQQVILEAFKRGNEPSATGQGQPIAGDHYGLGGNSQGGKVGSGTGGLY